MSELSSSQPILTSPEFKATSSDLIEGQISEGEDWDGGVWGEVRIENVLHTFTPFVAKIYHIHRGVGGLTLYRDPHH